MTLSEKMINDAKAQAGRANNNNNNNNNNNGPTIATAESGRKRAVASIDRARASIMDAIATIATLIAAFEGDRASIASTLASLESAIGNLNDSIIPSDYAAPAIRIGARARLTNDAPVRSMLPKADGLWTITAIDAATGKVTLSDRIMVAIDDIVPVK